jgi:hypothetical protein
MIGFPATQAQLPGQPPSISQPQNPYQYNPISNITAMLVKALAGRGNSTGIAPQAAGATGNTSAQGTYEGNIASPANPYANGQFGMQHQAQSGIPLPQPRPPTAPQATPTYGAPPVPFPGTSGVNAPQANPTMQALFSQPPSPNFLNIPM